MSTATMMGNFQVKAKQFNSAIASGNIIDAIDIGNDMILLALEQMSNAAIPAYDRDSYAKQAKAVLSHLTKHAEKGAGTALAKVSDSEGSVSDGGDPYYQEKQWFDRDVPDLNFKNIIGLQDVKDEFMANIIAPLKPEFIAVYKKFRGDQMGINLLLYGPPGTGKTHIVRCLAGALGCQIAVVPTSEILASVVGVGEKHMRAIFEQASKLERCIIFFDEIDSIASGRDSDDSRHTKAILTTMLTCMDGFKKNMRNGQLRIIVAATNRPWILDSALKRGGRFETQIYVPLPDRKARLMFVEKALKGIPCSGQVTPEVLAEKLAGYAGADINAIVRQIANKPLRREIYNILGSRGEQGEVVEEQDCNEVLSAYINSVTPEMLMMFEAYKANMEYDEFLKFRDRQD